jgi:NAD(P)-dependent dehydrogenase (short-subunit alcohol dehydrogenase family)
MNVLVIGATGIIGSAVADGLAVRHDVRRMSRPEVDLNDPRTFGAALGTDLDAVVCCAASAPLTALTDDGFLASIQAKLLGQVELVRAAAGVLNDRGSITITSGKIPEALPGSAGGALVNAGLEAFVAAAALELPRGLRLNVVSPGWVRETLEVLEMDPRAGVPVARVARAYVEAVEGTANGATITP